MCQGLLYPSRSCSDTRWDRGVPRKGLLSLPFAAEIFVNAVSDRNGVDMDRIYHLTTCRAEYVMYPFCSFVWDNARISTERLARWGVCMSVGGVEEEMSSIAIRGHSSTNECC